MTEVVAVSNFQHHGRKLAGDVFTVSPQVANELERIGLVQVLGDGPAAENPTQTAGTKSSVLPADPVSPPPTAAPRKRGRPKKQAAGS